MWNCCSAITFFEYWSINLLAYRYIFSQNLTAIASLRRMNKKEGLQPPMICIQCTVSEYNFTSRQRNGIIYSFPVYSNDFFELFIHDYKWLE